MLLEVVVMNKRKGSCYGGNERKSLSINSYGHKLVREKHDGQFRKERKNSSLMYVLLT
jgi:hypothetical protein